MKHKIFIACPIVALCLAFNHAIAALANEPNPNRASSAIGLDEEAFLSHEQKEFSYTASDLVEETTVDDENSIALTDLKHIFPTLTFDDEFKLGRTSSVTGLGEESFWNYEQKEFSYTVSDLVAETTADEENSIDPTDPTNIVPSLSFIYERTEFSDDQGDSNTFSTEVWIPLSNRDLLTIEAKLVNINLSSTADGIARGDELSFFDRSEARGIDATNIGDTRLRYFHLISVENGGIFRAWAPSLDTSIPTGSSDDGTGGDYWIISPNVVLAFDLSERISAYTFFRYVQGFATNSQPDINGINIEVPVSFAFSEATFLTLTLNFFHDFGESDTSFLTGKVGLTQMLSDSVGATIEVNLPIAGESGIDYSIKPSLFIYF